jgi:hypothetical protein
MRFDLDRASIPDRPLLSWFLDAGNDDTLGALSWPASKKRQGTKSREVWHPAVQRVLWGSYVGGDLDGGRGASTRRRGMRACRRAQGECNGHLGGHTEFINGRLVN